MSNRVTIFLNTAYDKLGGKADMQFRLSVLQAQQQTHWGVCVFIFISVCSVFWGGNTGSIIHQGKIGFAAKYVPSGNKTIILS